MFNPARRQQLRAEARAALGLAEDEIAIVYVGRISAAKGVDKILATAGRLIERGLKVKLLVAGDAKIETFPELDFQEKLHQAARQYPANRITFLGWVPYTDLIKLYAAADISVLASLAVEGNSFFLIESMACGIPVVSTAVGGVPEVVVADQTGLLIGRDDITANLENALARLVLDDELRQKMGRQAAQHAARNLTIQTCAREFENFLAVVNGQRQLPGNQIA